MSIVTETWEIVHATVPHYLRPWKELDPIPLYGIHGKSVAAPGVIYDEGKFLAPHSGLWDFKPHDKTLARFPQRRSIEIIKEFIEKK
jgi:hypothetical protein